jgi:hypothetical protein
LRKYIVLHSFVHSFISYLHLPQYLRLPPISISLPIAISLAVSIFLAIFNPRRNIIIQISKIISKSKAKKTVRCVWPIEREVAY